MLSDHNTNCLTSEAGHSLRRYCQDIQQQYITYKLDVCNVHAVFDDPADRLLNVGFRPQAL